ncbi:transcription elongation factor GreAB [Pelobium manganitolerans]|uniref:Transcription elongation factor GreAB n=1 Tax=Pelobium manganitolerans TaxID=1842495 RepID=A0A419S2W2_9SPHI|nr:GreA/GreB family elongation factor [Pelobium manganitolerans]RKD13319.1 transcription elongation factor GreAB [Pelobium manganitolerans]
MSVETLEANPKHIVLTTGIYDLIKEHIRRRKVTREEEEVLNTQLKYAEQVLRKDLPADVVTINTRVTVKNHSTNEELVYTFVGPERARKKNKTESILSKIGLATVGCKEGDLINWELDGVQSNVEILKVERLP